jgi:putative transposase
LIDFKRELIDEHSKNISVRRQCELIGLSRSSLYYSPAMESDENLKLMKMIDKQYLKTPFYGSRRMTSWLNINDEEVNRKRVQRLMKVMRLEAIYPRQNTSKRNAEHKIYPYLLRGIEILRPNQVWSTDITYIPMKCGFMYLVAVMDWFSRYVLSWEISNSLDTNFCIRALNAALKIGTPEIFNTDQGCQFTSNSFTNVLLNKDIKISMDGKGRAFDNIFIERLWRSFKYEDLYLNDYDTGSELIKGCNLYFNFFNNERPHQSLGYQFPKQVHYAC